jgi:hypothetical protein
MEHFNELLFLPLEWKNQIHEDGTRRCAYKKRMWIVHKFVATKDESHIANTNKGDTILGWDTMQ